jgi:hypothetical protein
LITSLKSSHFGFVKYAPTTAMNFRLNFTGMSNIWGSGTPTLNAERLSSTAKLSAHTVLISRNSINSSVTKVTSIWRQNSMNGNAFTTLHDHMVHITDRPLTKPCESG